ncbi:hypothetical protein L7F22_052070 [Adiantum nelumboides]|nr:hypothetical protein [Adiantum nelumboides]
MERALFSASFNSAFAPSPLLCPRKLTRFSDFDNHSSAAMAFKVLYQEPPHYLQIACLALQLPESESCQDWPRAHKRNGSFVAAASLLRFVHSLRAFNVVTSTLLCTSKSRSQTCHCSAEHGSSLSKPTTFNYQDEAMRSQESGDGLCCDGKPDEHELLERNGTLTDFGESRPSSQMIEDEKIVEAERVEQNGFLNSNTASSNEGSPIPVKEPIYEVMAGTSRSLI